MILLRNSDPYSLSTILYLSDYNSVFVNMLSNEKMIRCLSINNAINMIVMPATIHHKEMPLTDNLYMYVCHRMRIVYTYAFIYIYIYKYTIICYQYFQFPYLYKLPSLPYDVIMEKIRRKTYLNICMGVSMLMCEQDRSQHTPTALSHTRTNALLELLILFLYT